MARRNLGWRLDVPSDFSLLGAPDAALLSRRRRLVRHPDVVRVTPERAHRSSAAQSAAARGGEAGCGGAARRAVKSAAATASPRSAACGSRRVRVATVASRRLREAHSAAPLPRRRLLGADKGAESARTLRADVLWQRGRRGEGVRIAVFDTGLGRTTSQSNWTDEDTQENKIGHGSFVSGCIGASSTQCPGLAPQATLLTTKGFTNDQRSHTSWFLDAASRAGHTIARQGSASFSFYRYKQTCERVTLHRCQTLRRRHPLRP